MLISVIIPTFNRADFLCEALRGLLADQEASFECMIVDDASTDDTAGMVAALQAEFGESRVVFLSQESNQGAQAARNRGIEGAAGEFFFFMDSDDMPQVAGILELYGHLQRNPDLGYCFGRVQKTGVSLKPLGDHDLIGSPFGDKPREIAGYHWHTMGALYRRSCIERVGPWNLELTGSQDWEYQARVKLFGGKGEFVDTLVGYWRQHDGERVGTAKFRPDYVRSVMLACESILTKARECGRCDAELEKRIAKRLVVHALEWGMNGYPSERRACFEQAAATLRDGGAFALMLSVFSKLPSAVDGLLWRYLTRR
jgi:glycosyltransferase involved in cell wall biosynthesis